MIPFGEYLPDLPDLENPGATVANNVIPAASSYLPLPSAVAFSDALTAYCRGAVVARDKDNLVYNYAGDETKLYRLVDDTQTDASRLAGGAYATAAADVWEFAKWDQQVLATNYTDDVQAITLGGANFAALAGSPPKARHITTVRRFVVLGNIDDTGDGKVPNRVHWSGIGDETTWAVSASTQADFQDLKGSGGWVQRVLGGEYGVVMQERSIWRMSYASSPVIWQFDEVLPGRGCFAPNSVAQIGDLIFYLSEDGFEMLQNGSQSTPIGHNKIDRTFFVDLDASNLHRMSAAADASRKLIWWAYPGVGNTGGLANKVVLYDWGNNRWASSQQSTEFLYSAATTGYTLDGLDSVNSSLDALTESLDSRAWMGGIPEMAKYDADSKLAFLTGPAMDATLETVESEITPGQQSMLSAFRPLVDGGTVTSQVATRNRQTDAHSYGPELSQGATGEFNTRATGRYHRARVKTSGDFTHAQGIDVTLAQPAGRR